MPTLALPPTGTTPTRPAREPAPTPAPTPTPVWAKDRDLSDAGDASELSFGDLLDIINPLQHIPIIGTIYRELTGDTISFAAKTVGDTLFGGLPGLVASVVDSAIDRTTGKDSGEHLLAFLQGPEPDADVAALQSDDDGDGAVVAHSAAAPAARVARADPTPATAQDVAENPGAVDAIDDIDDIDGIDDRAGQTHPQPQAFAGPAATPAPDTRRQAALYQARYASQPQPLQTRVSMNNVRGGGGAALPLDSRAVRGGGGAAFPQDSRAVRGGGGAAFPQDSRAVRGGGAFAGLPAPQVLAANPNLIAAVRGGGAAFPQDSRAVRGGRGAALPLDSRAARGGGVSAAAPQTPTLPNGAWVQLMQAAPAHQPGGPNSLATATYARAIAGANGGGLPLDSLGAATKR